MVSITNSPNVVLASDPSFLAEIWIWYAIGVTIITLRYIVRIRTVGFRGFEGDDYLAVFSLALYTADAVLVDVCYHKGTSVDVRPEKVDLLTKAELHEIREGSKAQLAAWYTYTGLIWTMKFMLLFFYRRLTFATFQAKLVRYSYWICGATYIAVFLTVTFGCHPTSHNWQIRPLPPRACTFKPQNFYVGAVLNVITDAFILAIPIPMLWKLQVKTSKKVAISILLCSGLFVITAAIVRAVLTLGSTPSGLNINRWGVRETIVGILTVNLPILRPLFSSSFWRRGGFSESYQKNYARPSKGTGTYELRSTVESKNPNHSDTELVVVSRSNSRASNSQSEDTEKGSQDMADGIVVVQQSYNVTSSPRDEEEGRADWSQGRRNTKMGAFKTNITSGRHHK